MGRRRIPTPSAREYIAEWRRDAATDRGARWGDNDTANKHIREEVDADKQVIAELRECVKCMTPDEALRQLDGLRTETRELERGDPATLEQTDARVRLLAFVKSDRLTRAQRRDLLERWVD